MCVDTAMHMHMHICKHTHIHIQFRTTIDGSLPEREPAHRVHKQGAHVLLW